MAIEKITVSGKIKMGAVDFKITATIEYVIGNTVLAEGNVNLVKGETVDVPEIVIYEYPTD